jgi:hypothetical protein
MRRFAALPQLRADLFEYRFLGSDEALQVVRILHDTSQAAGSPLPIDYRSASQLSIDTARR